MDALPADPVVEARDVEKRYGARVAVAGVSFAVRRGECFGILGPNGAGKSSLMRMIGCQSPVTAGTLRVLGEPAHTEARRIKARLGVVPQEDTLDGELRVRENLCVHASYFGLPRAEAARRADAALARLALADRAGDTVEALSGGMRRRLALARALLTEPACLLLDEPTTGLDPQARHLLWGALRALKAAGTTVLLTTHYMEEAAALADRVMVLHQGRVVAEGTPAELIARHVGESVVEVRALDPDARARAAAALRAAGATCEEAGDTLHAFGLAAPPAAWPADLPRPFQRPADLEDVFLRLTGRGLDAEDEA